MAIALSRTLLFLVAAAASALDDSTVLLQRMQEPPHAAPHAAPPASLVETTAEKEGDIFEDLVDGINSAISSLKGMKNATKGVIHQAKTGLEQAGKQFSEGMEKTMREAIRHELAQQDEASKKQGKEPPHAAPHAAPPASLLATTAEKEGDIFEDLVDGINSAISSLKGMKNATRGVIHQAKTGLEHAGKQFSEGMEKTMREAIRHELIQQDEASKNQGKVVSLLGLEESTSQGDIFKDMVQGINLAIDSISRGLKNATRGVVHEAKAELEQAGKQFSEGMEKTMREAIRKEIDGAAQQEGKVVSLLDLSEGSTHETARQGDIFKDMVQGINLAIDSISRGLKNATRGVVHEAKAELEQAGKQFSEGMEKIMREAIRREITLDGATPQEGKVVSLLDLAEGSTHESAKQGDIFKDMVQGINLAIDSISRGLKNATRGVVHQAKAELEQAGKQFSEGMEKTMREAIRKEIMDVPEKQEGKVVSLLSLAEGSTHESARQGDIFKDMVQGINLAIDSISKGLKNATRGVVHQAKAELEQAGKQFSEGMEKTMREAIRREISLDSSATQQPVALSAVRPVSLIELDRDSWGGSSGFFEDMVQGINLAIESISTGLKNATRGVVHQAKAELEHAGKQFSEGMEKTMREAIRKEIMQDPPVQDPPAQLLQEAPAQQEAKVVSLLSLAEGSAHESARQGDIFKDMVQGINLAIDAMSKGLKNATRKVVHEAAAELEQAGKQFSEGMEQTMREAIRKEITTQDGDLKQVDKV